MRTFRLTTQFWVGDSVNPSLFLSIMLVLILLINFISVKVFGEFEFWLSAIKAIVIVGVIILLIVLALGGGPT
jgi:yeast amino acid transporter